MKDIRYVLIGLGFFAVAQTATATERLIRASEMTPTTWSDLTKGRWGDVVVEFRQGDELPVTLDAQGDLFETTQASVSYVGVKKNFWLRLRGQQVDLSFDGRTFKKLSDSLTGRLDVGAGSAQNGGVADAIQISLKVFQK